MQLKILTLAIASLTIYFSFSSFLIIFSFSELGKLGNRNVKMSAFDNLAKIFESRSSMVPVLLRFDDQREAGEELVTWQEDGKRRVSKLKGGLVDRSMLSWVKIIGVTAVWWAALVQASRN